MASRSARRMRLNAVDVGILVIVGIFAVGGLRRGFLLGLVDLVAFALALIVAARMSDAIARPLIAWGIPGELAAGAAFVIAVVIGLAVIGLVGRILLAPFNAIGAGSPLGWANSVLGMAPGAIRGLAMAALVLLLLSVLPAEIGARGPIAASRLAQPIDTAARQAMDAGLRWAGIDPLSLGALAITPVPEAIELPFTGVTAVAIDTAAESDLLDLINQERTIAGLTPLAPDAALAEAGRRHGREMFELGYFSHTSPVTGGPADRLLAAGLSYPLSDENIALAPTTELAHEGFMKSPRHRANILNPRFSRVGISVLRSDEHGLMITQEFAG